MERFTEELNEHGFYIVKAPWVVEYKNEINEHLLEVAKFVTKKINPKIYEEVSKEDNLTDFLSNCHRLEKDNEITRQCYEVFPAQAKIISLVNHKKILETVQNSGIDYPIPGTLPLVRVDRPKYDHYLTPSHQDYWYSMLCDNSVVVWYTLTEIEKNMGFLKVIPGSHKEGLIPFKIYQGGHEPYVPINEYNDEDYIEIKTDQDEILIFHQMLLHKSGVNRSDKIRLSMQLRYNDLETAKRMTSTFVPNHSPHVLKEQERILQKEN